jgi:hypothetical protein
MEMLPAQCVFVAITDMSKYRFERRFLKATVNPKRRYTQEAPIVFVKSA